MLLRPRDVVPAALWALAVSAAAAAFAQTPPPSPCALPEMRQFDFWVGEWALTWADSGRGTNTITREFDDCVVRESFRAEGPNALAGMSVSTYDARSRRWKQTWVDNQGGYLDFTGEFAGSKMTLSREALDREGKPVRQRMVWANIERDALDWSWERSRDGGKSWETLWAIRYRRKA